MTPSRLIVGVSVLFAASIAAPFAQQPAQPPAGAPPAQGQQGRGRGGGGRGNPMIAKFTEVCATCHGTSQAKGPVGPSLFAEQWIHGGDDDSIITSIKNGYPEKGMPAFKDQLSDQDIWQMIAYIRTQTQSLKDKPVYVPDPDG